MLPASLPSTARLPHTAAVLPVLLLVSALLLTGCSDQRKQAGRLVTEGTELRGAGRNAEALRKLSQATALAPELAEAHYGRGLCLSALDRPAEAVIALETAVRLKPDWAEALHALGTAQLKDHNPISAEQTLTRAIETDARLTAAWFARSEIRLQSLQDSAALHDLDAVLRRAPDHREARLRRARLLLESHPEQAIEDLSVLLQHDRLNTEALLLRGRAWGNAGNQQRALSDLAAACQLQPEMQVAWRERGRQLRITGDPEAARKDLQHALQLAPQDTETLFELALTEKLQGDRTEAERLLLQVLALAPEHPAARLESARLLMENEQHSDAARILAGMIEDPVLSALKPAILGDARLLLATALEQLKQPETALQQTTILLAERPHDETTRRLHAELLQQLSRSEEALKELTWLLSQRHEDAELRLQRAGLQAEIGDYTAALQDLNLILTTAPEHAPALMLRARVLQSLENPVAALQDVDQLLLLPAVSSDVRRLRADLLTQLQREPEADAEYLHPDLFPQATEQILLRLIAAAGQTGGIAAQQELLDRAITACPAALSTTLKIQHAELLLEQGQLSKALTTLEQLPENERQQPHVLLLTARIQLANEHPHEAVRLLQQIPEDSRTPGILQLLADTLIRCGQNTEARQILNQLIEISPAEASPRIQRLKILTELEAWQEAEEDADVVLLNDPDNGHARLVRGMRHAQTGNTAAALTDLESDQVRKLDSTAVVWARCRCLLAAQRSTQASAELSRLLQEAPDHDEARLARADLELARGNFREASADYSVLLKKQPQNAELLLKRARLLLKVGRNDAAETDLVQLLRLQPLSAEAWHLRGLARGRMGQRDVARRDLERSLRLDATNINCLFDLADLEVADGRPVAALVLYDAALQLKPDHAIGWYNRGLALYRLNRLAEAADAWTRTIELRPGLDRAWNSRAQARTALGQHSDARRDLEQVLALKPGDPEAWEHYARQLLRCPDPALKDSAQAVLAARKACELSEFRDWKLLSLLAETLQANGQPNEALTWAEQARRTAPTAQRTAPAQLARSLQNQVEGRNAAEPSTKTRTAVAPARTNRL